MEHNDLVGVVITADGRRVPVRISEIPPRESARGGVERRLRELASRLRRVLRR